MPTRQRLPARLHMRRHARDRAQVLGHEKRLRTAGDNHWEDEHHRCGVLERSWRRAPAGERRCHNGGNIGVEGSPQPRLHAAGTESDPHWDSVGPEWESRHAQIGQSWQRWDLFCRKNRTAEVTWPLSFRFCVRLCIRLRIPPTFYRKIGGHQASGWPFASCWVSRIPQILLQRRRWWWCWALVSRMTSVRLRCFACGCYYCRRCCCCCYACCECESAMSFAQGKCFSCFQAVLAIGLNAKMLKLFP